MGEWISVRESVPLACTNVLVWDGCAMFTAFRKDGLNDDEFIDDGLKVPVRAEWWMPLPEPPKEV